MPGRGVKIRTDRMPFSGVVAASAREPYSVSATFAAG
jgi:hypothetical protein